MRAYKAVVIDYEFESLENERRMVTAAGGEFEAYKCKTDEEVIKVAKDAEILLVQYYEMTEKIIAELNKCKLIIRYGIGVNNVDLKAATAKGIYIANIPDFAIEEVADHTFALIMMLLRKLPTVMTSIRQGRWDFNIVRPIKRIKGQTIGLIGFGRIPRLLVEKMKGFGFNVLVYDPYAADDGINDVEFVDLDGLIRQSDIVSLHAPLTKDTKHMFNKETFFKMKDTAYLINTSRGALICEQDLIEAVEKNIIAGAAIDVTEVEPLSKDSKLRQLDNVIVTPHMAWYSEEALKTLQVRAAEYASMFINGEIPSSVINR